MYGRKHTPESLEKIRRARAKQKMKPLTEQQKKILSQKFKGRSRPPRLDGLPDHHSDETKEKIRQAHLGRPKKKGFKQSEEHKRKKLESYKATIAKKKSRFDDVKN